MLASSDLGKRSIVQGTNLGRYQRGQKPAGPDKNLTTHNQKTLIGFVICMLGFAIALTGCLYAYYHAGKIDP